jgi:hypothetical protein
VMASAGIAAAETYAVTRRRFFNCKRGRYG